MKENFDDIIRRRWEAQQFPVDEQHRQEMARMLEGEKKRRGIIFWWFGGVAVTLLVAIAMWMYNVPKAVEKPRTESTEYTEKELANNEEKADDKAKAEAEVDIKAKAKPEAEEKVVLKAGSSNASHDVKSKSSHGSKKSKPVNAVILKNQNSQTDSKLKPRTENTEDTEKYLVSKNVIEEKPMDPQQGAGNEIPKEGYKVELENPNQVSILSNEASIRVFPDSIEYDPWTNAIYHNGTVRSLNITKPLDALSIQDVESTKRNAPGNITPHTKVTHPVYFLAETGLGMVLASKPFYDGGIKFNVGGGLGIKVVPRIHLQLTGGYLMQDGGFHFERTSTVNSISFGVRSQFNSLAPDRLHFVYGKLGIAYRFQRSTLDIHTGVQWLYGAQGNITVQEQTQLPPYNPNSSRYAWLNTEGLRKTQWWSDVSYGYMLIPKLYLHGGVSFYYTSLIESNLPNDGYDWSGKTASVQPFITLNYLLHANF